jgi:hypothetical protein
MTTEPATTTAVATPIVCDMTGAPDTAEERMAEYGRLFAQALTGRARTAAGIRFRFRAGDGVEAWVRDLAAREKACCPFLDFTVTTADGQVCWDVGVDATAVDHDMVRTILDEFYNMPDTAGAGVAGMEERLNEQGLAVTRNASGTVMEIHRPAADA